MKPLRDFVMTFDSLWGIRDWLEKQKAERDFLEIRIAEKRESIDSQKIKVANNIKARWILSEVAKITQKNFEKYIESLVTMALRSVYQERDLKFLVDFEIKRNKSECFLMVQEGDGEPFFPKDEMGGGVVDVISFALRVVLWSLQKPRSANVLILDEPFKFVGKGELLDRVEMMLKEISSKLGFQLIIITHEPQLTEIADRFWAVSHSGENSIVLLDGKEKTRLKKRYSSEKAGK